MKFASVLLLLLVLAAPLLAQSPQIQDQQWQQNYARWQQLSPERREELRSRFEQFKALPTDTRQRLMEMAQRFRALRMEERETLRKRFELYTTLPPEEQQSVRMFARRWMMMGPLQRRMMRNRIERLRLMPPAERERMLQEHVPAWRRLNEQQREGLRRFLFESRPH